MNFVKNAIKLDNIKTYNTVGSNANQTFKKKFYSESKDIDNTVYENIDYNSIDLKAGIENSKNKKEWYEYVFDIANAVKDYGATFELSLVCGALELVENVGDALIMAGCYTASNIVSIWDEDQAKKIKEDAAQVVKYDWSEALYDASVDLLNVDDEIAHGITHTVGSAVGTAAAYAAVSCIPGGAAVTASVGAVTAFGSASEMALNSGASFDEAYVCGAVASIAGAGTGGALNKIQGAAAGAKSIAQVSGYTLAGMGISALEPVINTTTQYFAYGKDVVDENGNKVYSDYLDYYNKSGGLFQTGIASIAGGVSTGVKAAQGYNKFSKRKIEYMDDVTDTNLYDGQPTAKLFDSDLTNKLFDTDSRIYNTYDEFVEANAQVRTQWETSLTDREKTLIKNYILESEVSSYVTMNGIARGTCINTQAGTVTFYHTYNKPNKPTTYTFAEYTAKYGESVSDLYTRTIKESIELDAAIRRCRLSQDTIVARGMDANALSRFGIDINADSAETIMAKLGGTYSDAGFMSSTPVAGGGFTHKNINLIMDCPAGSACADFATFNPGEEEVLFPMGQQFNVDNVVKKDGKIYIYMTLKGGA